ncbi:MAG: hypothetical protein EOO48_13690 [Flavobacterium sp.]|nr:MAG: hypothetical protein EOO48_13690 [Flavobacterium sp.]
MKKVLLLLVVLTMSLAGFSQKGKNAVGIGAEVGIPIGDFSSLCGVGVGGYFKALYGVGSAGQMTFTTGYSVFKVKEEIRVASGVDKVNVRITPLLLGYRQNFSGFYLEPQLGYGLLSAKATLGSVSATESDGAFTYGTAFGAALQNGLDIGASYRSMSKDGSSTSWISINIGYNFSLRR